MQAAPGKHKGWTPCLTFGKLQLPVCPGQCSTLLGWIVLLSLLLPGCSHFRLPAIDPNGSCIFLPPPNTTQLTLPHLHSKNGQQGIIPNPAFAAPPPPPRCLEEGNQGVCNLFGHEHALFDKLQGHFEPRGNAGEIQLTPMRVVAPVGGEVVLLAGICGEDGYLMKREPLEWMLSPDSVGTFIAVGDDGTSGVSSFLFHDNKIEKLDVDFARGRTSRKETTITRGSPNCNDDIRLREGQTWLSISSPSEGVSRVTVLAPESDLWDRRRLTSTIYWVDAQWEFPSPVIQRAGETVQLVTRVTRAENLVPAENWIVQYTIVDPSIASFASAGGNQTQVRVNADGQAVVTLAANPDARGTTPIVIDVIRPAQPEDNLPQLVLGRGQTTVTFSAPGLNLEAFGQQIASIGEEVTFSAVLGNPGDVPAENVQLRAQIPAGTRLVSAVPQPTTQTPEVLIWDQGILPANQQLDVALVLEPVRANTISVLFEASGAGFPVRQRRVTTQIIEPAIEVRFAPAGGIAEAEIGQSVLYEIDVTNTGRQTLTDLRLAIESDPGLPEASQGENRVEQTIPLLQPGEKRSLGINFRVQQTGQLNVRLQASSGQTVLAEKVASIRGLEPRPKEPRIEVSIQFPESVQVGSTQRAIITVRNPGEVRLSDVLVEIEIDPTLIPRRVDSINASRIRLNDARTLMTWSAQDLLPKLSGDSGDVIRRLDVEFESRRETPQGRLGVRATCAQNVQAQDAAAFRAVGIQPPAAVEPPVLPPGQAATPPDNRQRSNQLKVELDDYRDPTVVGEPVRYNLIVINDRATVDRNVRVLLRLPSGVDLQSISRDGNPVNIE
ncbi:MAG: hypothetical protein NXI32_29790, partial [bacterium]|nr:hypothetical protein [bacterium]